MRAPKRLLVILAIGPSVMLGLQGSSPNRYASSTAQKVASPQDTATQTIATPLSPTPTTTTAAPSSATPAPATDIPAPPSATPRLTISLSSNLPSGQLVGTIITWTATSALSGAPVYRFSIGPSGGPYKVVRDFSPNASLTWMPMREGEDDVVVDVKDGFDTPTANAIRAVVPYAIASRVTGLDAVVSATANPLVFLYSAPPCTDGTMMVRFSLASASPPSWTATPAQICLPGQSVNILLTGMEAGTIYTVENVVDAGGRETVSPPSTLTTGTPPSTLTFPSFGSPATPGPQADLTASTTFHDLLPFVSRTTPNPLATDLAGNVVWYDDTTQSDLYPVWPTQLVPGGTVLLLGRDGATTTGFDVLREVDLAGDPLRETSLAAVNAQLTARGQEMIYGFHHDAQRLPNGDTAVLGQTEQVIAGHPIMGDMLVCLDSDFQVVWTWDAFDHLDPTRQATLGETCASADSGFCTVPDPQAEDWLHTNAIGWSPQDSDLTLSLRNQDWVIKIDYRNGSGNGDVLWRLGAGGDFSVPSTDPYPWFSHQHDAHYVDATTMVVFDNGDTRCDDSTASCDSRGQVFAIDEHGRVATPLLNVDLGTYASALGSAERLSNGNFIFTAGVDSPGPVAQVIEVGPDGSAIFAQDNTTTAEYRAFRLTDLYGTENPRLVSSTPTPVPSSTATLVSSTPTPVPPTTTDSPTPAPPTTTDSPTPVPPINPIAPDVGLPRQQVIAGPTVSVLAPTLSPNLTALLTVATVAPTHELPPTPSAAPNGGTRASATPSPVHPTPVLTVDGEAFIAVSPPIAREGEVVRVTGQHFAAHEAVTLTLNGAQLAVKTPIVTGADGNVARDVVVPHTLVGGANTLIAFGAASHVAVATQLTGVAPPDTRFYFAGGVNGPTTRTVVTVLNTSTRPAIAHLTFYFADGRTAVRLMTVGPMTHSVVSITDMHLPQRYFGMTVSADGPVAAQLTVRDGAASDILRGHTTLGTTWYLAEGYTGQTYHEIVSVLNPSPRRPAHVRFHVLPVDQHNARRDIALTVPAHAVALDDLNTVLPRQSFGLLVTADQPVGVERTLTFQRGSHGLTTRTATDVAATTWVLVGGVTVRRTQTYLTIVNPGDSSARVTARFYSRLGVTLGNMSLFAPPQSRANVEENVVAPGIDNVTATVTSSNPVVVEQETYSG